MNAAALLSDTEYLHRDSPPDREYIDGKSGSAIRANTPVGKLSHQSAESS
jgi:hypothetical protein